MKTVSFGATPGRAGGDLRVRRGAICGRAGGDLQARRGQFVVAPERDGGTSKGPFKRVQEHGAVPDCRICDKELRKADPQNTGSLEKSQNRLAGCPSAWSSSKFLFF